MRIGFISNDYNLTQAGLGGGIDTYVRQMASGLAAAGHDVHVVTASTGATYRLRMAGVTVHAVQVADAWHDACPELGEARGALTFAWQAWRKLRDLATADGRFDIVEAPEYKAQGLYAAQDDSMPLVVKCHAHLLLCLALNGIALAPDTALITDLERETLQRARGIHANSLALAARVAADYGLPAARIAHVPYGIDTERFQPSRSALRAQLGLAERPVALFVGRMEERKGLSTLVQAFAEVSHRMPDAVLLLAGPDVNGPPAYSSNVAWLCAEFEALGVPTNRFLYLGSVPHEQLPSVYAAADVMVAPSPFEAFGLVYLEAMACERPVIGCTGGGAGEVIAGGQTGLLVPPHDAAALADAIARLLTSTALARAFGQAGRAHVVDRFSLGGMVQRTLAFYERVAA